MPIDRGTFEDEFPVMFRFYYERGRLSEFQLQKVHEIQQRWKSGLVFWLTHDNQEIEIPEWVAVNVIINNKQNVGRGSRICMSLNHTKGYGCNRLTEGTCTYVHECALCGQEDHGVFQKRGNGSWICTRLRKWYEEEARYKAQGYGDPRKQEDALTELARRPRPSKVAVRKESLVADPGCGKPAPAGAPAPEPTDAKAAAPACQAAPDFCNTSADVDSPQHHRLPPAQPPPPRLPQNWQAIWCEEQRLYYYWHTPTNHTTWEAPELDAGTLEAARAAVLRARMSQVAPAKDDGNDSDSEVRPLEVGCYVCTQHWRPQPGDENCLRVFHGERLVVTWADGKVGSWAYGHVAGDESQAGYFPQAVLATGQRTPRQRAVGKACAVAERFLAPEEVAGYLSVVPGDILRMLHPTEPKCAWAYVERDGATEALGEREVGWVPKVVLRDISEAGGSEPEWSPHPAR